MIEHATGNLLEAQADALVNTVNTVGVMGKGIALQFRQAFPEVYAAYKRACDRGQVVPGKMLVVPTNALTLPRFVINFPTKRHWKGQSRIEDVEAGLEDLVPTIRRLNLRSIAVPPLGCGNGGLEWAAVRPLILKYLEPLEDVRVLLYEPHGSPRAEKMPVRTRRPAMTRGRASLLEAFRAYGEPGYRLNLLEVQKIAYFLQAAGEPLKLDFTRGKYGPYAEVLNHVLQRMEGHFIRGYGDRPSEAEIRVLSDAVAEAEQFLSRGGLPPPLAQVQRLICGFETPYGVELLASVHWVFDRDGAHTLESATAAVQAWSSRKRDLFTPAHIRKAWDRLSVGGWFERGRVAQA